MDVDISEETAASRLQVSRGLSPKNGLETTVSLSTMQALTPALALGGVYLFLNYNCCMGDKPFIII